MPPTVESEKQFQRLYALTYSDILGYMARRIGEQEAVDAAADVFLVAWSRIQAIPDGDAARPWLFGVARNVLRNRQRATRRYWRFLHRYQGLAADRPAEPEPIVVRRSDHEHVLSGLERLRPAERELLRLVAWEELPYAEIAALLGCSRHAVDQRVQRALHHLARAVSRKGQVPSRDIRTGEAGAQ